MTMQARRMMHWIAVFILVSNWGKAFYFCSDFFSSDSKNLPLMCIFFSSRAAWVFKTVSPMFPAPPFYTLSVRSRHFPEKWLKKIETLVSHNGAPAFVICPFFLRNHFCRHLSLPFKDFLSVEEWLLSCWDTLVFRVSSLMLQIWHDLEICEIILWCLVYLFSMFLLYTNNIISVILYVI